MEIKDSPLKETGEIKIGSFSAPISNPSTLSLINTDLENSFRLKYRLFGKENYDVITEIITGNVRDKDLLTSITPRVKRDLDLNTVVEFKYANSSNIDMEITPRVSANYDTEIFVNPSNRMWALYAVQQPPIITDTFNPVKDSFTRSQTSFQTINYGDSLSMVVGRAPDDVLRSFIQFDVSSIDPSYVLTDSYMRLYYKNSPPNNLKLEVLTASESWSEFGITDLNRPTPKTLVASEYTVNTEGGYVEFNVSNIVKDWVANRVINDGLIIRLSNETEYGQTSFNTRETVKPPQLVVNYYDSRIFSTGRAQIPTEISAIQKNDTDINTEITVNAVHDFSEFDTEIRIHIREISFDDDWLFEITSSRDKAYTEITASIFTEKEIPTIIEVRRSLDIEYSTSIGVSRDKVLTEITPFISASSNFNTEITITNDYIDTELTVRRTEFSDSETEISVRRTQESDIPTVIIASTPQILIEIDARGEAHSNSDTEITVAEKTHDDCNTEIFAKGFTDNDSPTEIVISVPSIGMEITPRVKGSSSPYTLIDISKPFVETEVTVKYRSSYDTEITADSVSKHEIEITVNRPEVIMEITAMVSDDSDITTEIQVPDRSDVDTEITVNVFNQYDTEITILLSNHHDTEITSTRPHLDVEITVPYYGISNRITEITPRIRLVDNVNTVIQVGKKKGSYVFMM